MRLSERASRFLITVGGIGTIAAVALIFVFLVLVVLPLFSGAKASGPSQVRAEEVVADSDPVHLAVDEYGLMFAVLTEGGEIHVFDVDSGASRWAEDTPTDPASYIAFHAEGWLYLHRSEGTSNLWLVALDAPGDE